MGAGELDQGVLGPVTVTARQRKAAALHIADRVAAEHPHPLDGEMPQLAGRLIAKDPNVRAEVRDLLNALGLQRGLADIAQLQDREVDLEAQLIVANADNQRLKEGQ